MIHFNKFSNLLRKQSLHFKIKFIIYQVMINIESLIKNLQNIPVEVNNIFLFAICYLSMFLMAKYFKQAGLYVYSVVAVIACNLQVLKAMEFSWLNEPIALGSIVYASTFLASDALTEIYGAKSARKSIGLSFGATIILLLMMVITLGFKPLAGQLALDHAHFNQAHEALAVIFMPNPAIICASLIAYIISQLTDIYVFSYLKERTKHHLVVRVIISISLAAFIDSCIFSILAWKVFAISPVSNHSLFYNYILGGYAIQMLVAAINALIFPILIRYLKDYNNVS